MPAQNNSMTEGASPERYVSGRNIDRTAPLRCASYAALSDLTTSPHEVDPRPALREKMGMLSGLEYARDIEALLSEFVEREFDELKREYSGLFEVGSDGPPVPIREDLQTGQRGGTREELVRFYNYFNYSLAEKFAWAPDHLSVQLEFMHFLCFQEASGDENALSYQLAQADFLQRHLLKWVPRLAANVDAVSPGSIYCRVVGVLNGFLDADANWQAGTISTVESADE